MDVGGTLSKLVYFEKFPDKDSGGGVSKPKLKKTKSFSNLDSPEHKKILEQVYDFMGSTAHYGSTGVRDIDLAAESEVLGGILHFIRFNCVIKNLNVYDFERSRL